MLELSALVTAAQHGDKAAFGQIVIRFQDMAFASAYALLGETGAAQDAAQEAFIDAYRTLPKLREPAAFPGWFTRIIFKHSDRQVRGKQATILPSAGLDQSTKQWRRQVPCLAASDCNKAGFAAVVGSARK